MAHPDPPEGAWSPHRAEALQKHLQERGIWLWRRSHPRLHGLTPPARVERCPPVHGMCQAPIPERVRIAVD